MFLVIMTVFSTHYFKKARFNLAAVPVCVALCWLVLCGMSAAYAQQAHPTDVLQLQVERGDDGLYLSAMVNFDTPALVEDALLKGIPLFFVVEAEVLRNRWYWYDQRLASATRYLRLVYQPLTRRWRLNVSPAPIGNSGLGVTVSQNFDDIGEALTAVRRVSRWKIADADRTDADTRYDVNFRFRLDISQLPQPFQIGISGRPDWNLSVARTVRLAAEPSK